MSDNPFEGDLDETPGGSDSASMKQLRDFAKRIERENQALKKDLETAGEKLAKARAIEVRSAFKEAQLSEKHAALFVRLNPEAEATPEAIRAFAEENDLGPIQTSEAPPQETEEKGQEWKDGTIVEVTPPETKPAGFAPVDGGGHPAGSIIEDAEVAQKLFIDNPAEYIRLREAGRIKLPTLPGNS